MVKTPETIYLSPKKTYVIRCSKCRQAREYHVSKAPHTKDAIDYQCDCGHSFPVKLVSFRRAPRKDVSLSAILVRTTPKGPARISGQVENLSVRGMRITIDLVPDFRDQSLKVLMVIPLKVKRTLDVSCRVCRIASEQGRLRLALEFQGLTEEQERALDEFVCQ
jgi:PilZ domain-containing protein